STFQPPVAAPPPISTFQPPVAAPPPMEFQPPPPGPNLFGAPAVTPPPPAYDMTSAMMAGPPSVDSLIESLITDIGDSLDGIDDLEMVNRITGAHHQASVPPPPPPSIAAPAPVAQGMFRGLEESGLQDIFDEFKHSIEQEEAEEAPDFETHYNLGLAYKDMELFDEAVEEFQAAIKATDPHAPDGHYFQSCNMLGLCFMSKAMYPPAAVWFKRGLDAPGRSEDEYQAMRFDLGLAHEMQGKLESALELFEIVYAIDINYRDVGEKIKEIKEKLRK
ncbi:MAG TPA: tetratricopeptide repeat protein, partial [Acidobacteriota bacterium]|nr:tetratricopeptide repeat protein [Acidobacteriota bacterium]